MSKNHDVNTTIQQALYDCVQQYPQTSGWVLALSGGLDSKVLLHALANSDTSLPVRAIHINHNLHAESYQWVHDCAHFCAVLKIPFATYDVNARAKAGESPEAAARNARYAALQQALAANEVLCLAHHQNDQAETLLLQLIRGAGLKGLSAMPTIKMLAQYRVLRPMLALPRSVILNYAKQYRLTWIEDPSNQEQCYDRNFIRHTILAQLQQRWPSVCATLARTAQCVQAAQQSLDDYIITQVGLHHNWQQKTLTMQLFRGVSLNTQQHFLRYWLQCHQVTPPSLSGITRIIEDVIHARVDAQPEFCWGTHVIRRYQQRLYLLKKNNLNLSPTTCISWDLQSSLQLKHHACTLEAKQEVGQGIVCHKLNKAVLRVGVRQGGERMHAAGRCGSHPLKKLLQDWNIPPWERHHIPLLYFDNQLIAVPGFAIAEGWQSKVNDLGWVIRVIKDEV